MDTTENITELRKKRFAIIKAMTAATDPREKERLTAEYSKIDRELGQADARLAQADIPAKAVQLELFPEWDDSQAAMPNSISRSALFACVHPGRRKWHDTTLIASRKDVTIEYTGKQLDIGDADVYLQVIRTIERLELETDIQIFPYAFLREMGRNTGKTDKLWLDNAFDRLTTGTVTIHVPGKYKAKLHLVDLYIHDEDTDSYYLRVSKEAVKLFKDEHFALIDWDARKELKLPLSRWLQTYAASNLAGVPQIISFAKLKDWCGQGRRRMDHFIKALEKAVKELENAGIITDVTFNKKGKKLSYIALKNENPSG